MSDEIEIDPLHQRAGADAYIVADAIIKLAREVRGLRRELAMYLNDEDEGLNPVLKKIDDNIGDMSMSVATISGSVRALAMLERDPEEVEP